MSIDSRDFTYVTSYTVEGAKRNNIQFWKMWAEKYPQTLSEINLQKILRQKAPIVDDKWISYFPEHTNYLNRILVHHHIDHGSLTTALPDLLHSRKPDRSLFHSNLGGPKKGSEKK